MFANDLGGTAVDGRRVGAFALVPDLAGDEAGQVRDGLAAGGLVDYLEGGANGLAERFILSPHLLRDCLVDFLDRGIDVHGRP